MVRCLQQQPPRTISTDLLAARQTAQVLFNPLHNAYEILKIASLCRPNKIQQLSQALGVGSGDGDVDLEFSIRSCDRLVSACVSACACVMSMRLGSPIIVMRVNVCVSVCVRASVVRRGNKWTTSRNARSIVIQFPYARVRASQPRCDAYG